jgi:tetratricopeptide (TPR) repeat protein
MAMISRWHLWYRFHPREQSGVALKDFGTRSIGGVGAGFYPLQRRDQLGAPEQAIVMASLSMMVTPNIVMRAPTGLALLVFSCTLAGCEDPRADCAKVQDNPAQSIQACTKIINAGGDTRHNLALAFFNRGAAFNNLGNYDAGITDLTQALALDAKYAKAYYNRALAYHHKGDFEQGLANYNEAIRLNPKDHFAYSNRGAIHLKQGDYDSAITDTTQAIRLDARDHYAYATRAAALLAIGDDEHAIADLSEAIRIAPGEARSYATRGWASFKKLRIAMALADLDQAIRLNPREAHFREMRATIYERMGRTGDAAADFHSALLLDPSRLESSDGLKRLGATP